MKRATLIPGWQQRFRQYNRARLLSVFAKWLLGAPTSLGAAHLQGAVGDTKLARCTWNVVTFIFQHKVNSSLGGLGADVSQRRSLQQRTANGVRKALVTPILVHEVRG